jgi:hypothetical protein
MVRFNGSKFEGYRALGIALSYGFSVRHLERVGYIDAEGEITGPQWEIILR